MQVKEEKIRACDRAYEKNGRVYSSFQRHEIIEITYTYAEDRHYVSDVKVVGHWTDYEQAKKDIAAFNKRKA